MNDIGIYLKKIHTLLERRRNYEYREYDLTSTQLDVLEYLYFNTKQKNTLSDIAFFFGVQHTSVIHVLKILEKKGFICKERAKQGSRCKPILLTQRGFDIMQSHLCCPSDLETILFSNISKENIIILEKLLQQIYENLMRHQPDNLSKGEEENAK